MSDMVDRIARVLSEDDPDCVLSIETGQHMARIVLEAMREPTVEMLIAAQEEWMCVRAAEERGDFIWRAMIDAALEGKT